MKNQLESSSAFVRPVNHLRLVRGSLPIEELPTEQSLPRERNRQKGPSLGQRWAFRVGTGRYPGRRRS